MRASEIRTNFETGACDDLLLDLYGDRDMVAMERDRYVYALNSFMEHFGDLEVSVFTAAGRTEVSGNHTDHQHGRVLAASVNLDSIGVAAKADDVIEVVSDAFDIAPLSTADLTKDPAQEGTSEALIKGVYQGFVNDGYHTGGMKAFVTSNVLAGAGLSSSASFEVLIGCILNGFYNDNTVPLPEIAKIAQYAENEYFGKPCGLMDQCACACGGLVTIDFNDPKQPVIEPIPVDFAKYGHSLCIVDTKGSHADLTDEYAAIPQEMKSVARAMGKDVLRQVDEAAFYASLPALRKECGDRAVLRAVHFFNENRRVPDIVQALKADDFDAFLAGINASGNSSFEYLQNVFPKGADRQMEVALGLALAQQALEGTGASRVHGGGFAGTIQAFVPDEKVPAFKELLESCFGPGSCHVLKIRKYGGHQVL
ncbi:galactokinase family protein [uncultured Faecalibaculum sp.]|uniref:galactokinase n=2 Tax=uncultured Faecalibaculum sp. TaxID=1729681 RepID=UPI0025D5496B|nr:galactokinase family protein [uncultured Faecalibaculum sp.]